MPARIFIFFVIISCFLVRVAAAAGVPVTAFTGASVINESGTAFESGSTIIIRDGKIVAIGRSGAVTIPAGARTVPLNGRYVVPGLVNSHVHLATLAVPAQARAYLRRELYSGVTMVRDMAGDVRLLAELQREAAADEIVAPDIYYASLFAGPSFFVDPRSHDASRGIEPGKAPWMQAISPETDLRLAVARAKGTGATAIKLYADLPAPLVTAITAEAHRQSLLVWSHAAIFPARPSEIVEAGVDVMSHADFIGFESITPFPQSFQQARRTDLSAWKLTPAVSSVLSKMKSRGLILDATVDVGFRDPIPTWPASVAVQLAREAHKRGIPISAGTDDDADWKDPNSALLAEIERLVHDVGMTNAEALRAATVVGARTVGEQATLAAGHAANFVVLGADPLQDIRNLRNVILVVKHGIEHQRSAYEPATSAPTASNAGHSFRHQPGTYTRRAAPERQWSAESPLS